MTAVTRKAERTKNWGLSRRMPAAIRVGIVPDTTQVPISMPMASRMRMTGRTAASFSPVERWISDQVAPPRTACRPATVAAARMPSTNSSEPTSRKSPPSTKRPTRVRMGSAAAAVDRGCGVLRLEACKTKTSR